MKMARSMTYTALPNVPMVKPGDDICDIIKASLESARITLRDHDIVVIAQKIISKSEDRFADLSMVSPSRRAQEFAEVTGKDPRLVELVLSESSEVLRTKKNVMVVVHKRGYVMANAGIDESNISHDGAERVLLLPVDPDRSCRMIKEKLDHDLGVSIGVVINDSFGRAWRNGVVGVALGSAGLPSLESLIGLPDLFGRQMKVTEVAVADELAAAASLVMGQGAEGQPVIHVRGYRSAAPYNDASALIRPKEMDMFR
jgi:coenzyme F420-0:L-glutamate ligase / coenzyme F420-1:gamma-L-glutamate ligase